MSRRPVAVYRTLLRSARKVFKGDALMLDGARTEIRSKYKVSSTEINPSTIERLCAEGEEAADFLKTYVVQAKLNERGNYAMQVQREHAGTTAEEGALRR